MKPIIYALILGLQIAHAAAAVVPPRQVRNLVKPILDLQAAAETSTQDNAKMMPFGKVESSLGNSSR